jgi:hypothetical protein
VAGDVEVWEQNKIAHYTCPACDGKGIVWEPEVEEPGEPETCANCWWEEECPNRPVDDWCAGWAPRKDP